MYLFYTYKIIMSDKLQGLFYGLTIGDALGVPYEFSHFSPKLPYTGLLHQVDGHIQFRFAMITIPKNSPSDDTRMSLALLRALYKNDFIYSYSEAVQQYLMWAKDESMLGKNTRKLFKGITTIKGYKNRYDKITESEKILMQSNGSLMRISPMALIINEEDCIHAIIEDTSLTNPNDTNTIINILYVSILRKIIYDNSTKSEIIDFVKHTVAKEEYDNHELLRAVLKDAINLEYRDISVNKGHVVNAIYICIYCFVRFDSFQESMDYIINKNPKSDTDTNAAITGAVFGAYLGFEQMNKEVKTSYNIQMIKDRPEIKEFEEILYTYGHYS